MIRQREKEWNVFTTQELERIKLRKKDELDEILDNWTNHELATLRAEILAFDIAHIDMELKTRE